MRIVPFLLSCLLTIIIILALSLSWGSAPPFGSFFSPQHGFWLNAEPVDKDFSDDLNFSPLTGNVDVYFDDRMVPHVFADNEEDAWFVQGYLHAKFGLWQMELQTHAAAGRLTEILGVGPDSAILNNDRNMRRLGMEFGARNSLQKMEADASTKQQLDAYTAGVNSYIENLSNDELPFEYRLLNYAPEKWNNLKTALFLKYMSYDLTGEENDIEYTNAKSVLTREAFEKMYPISQDSLDPIVPKGTPFAPPGFLTHVSKQVDSIYNQWIDSVKVNEIEPDRDNGSNNWAVSGMKTISGRPILSNDPHLGINLPSLWFEIQITTPEFSVYGVSFPGAPSVIIGFNDHIAWGVTNAMRDVKDYYEIEFRDNTKSEYKFEGEWREADVKVEVFNIRNGHAMYDTVAYTLFGPVQYDASFTGKGRTGGKQSLAVRWKAHDASNELKTFALLNKAKNYNDYLAAIRHFICPGQNFVFASKTNEIAIWQQASFPAKWKRQGDFVMPGIDSSYLWQGEIPQEENPHLINPERGFVSSANQLPVDTSYPYYVGGHHDLYRGLLINRKLDSMNGITPQHMQALQNENYNVFAEMALPVLLNNIDMRNLSNDERKYLNIVRTWNRRNDPDESGVTVFNSWVDSLEAEVWADEFSKIPTPNQWPEEYTLIEALKRDSAFEFVDNTNTDTTETLKQVVTTAFKKAVPQLVKIEQEGRLPWWKFKGTHVRHLSRLPALSRTNLKIGGGTHIINATKKEHAPSWKMVVHLTDNIEAYGVYPGGQIGNPGSKYYDMFVDDWAAGKYNTLWVMRKEDAGSEKVIARMSFRKS